MCNLPEQIIRVLRPFEPVFSGRVWPWATPRGDFVALALSSPDGNALFEVPRSVLVRFLRRTYVVVPRGRETDHLDVDAALVRLLAGR